MQSDNLLNKKNIAIIFPAWTNCGTYRVVVGQIAAYAEMGANTEVEDGDIGNKDIV